MSAASSAPVFCVVTTKVCSAAPPTENLIFSPRFRAGVGNCTLPGTGGIAAGSAAVGVPGATAAVALSGRLPLTGSLRRSRRLHGEGGHVDRHDAVEAVEGWIDRPRAQLVAHEREAVGVDEIAGASVFDEIAGAGQVGRSARIGDDEEAVAGDGEIRRRGRVGNRPLIGDRVANPAGDGAGIVAALAGGQNRDENSVEARLYPVVLEFWMFSATVPSLFDCAFMPETPLRRTP